MDVSGVFGQILDKLGVWNYVIKSSLTTSFASQLNTPIQYFWAIDEGEFVATHAIVVALPFGIIDLTIKYQHYINGEENTLPNHIIVKECGNAFATIEDIVSTNVLSAMKR